jgi:phosphatidylglycerophosphate synthase
MPNYNRAVLKPAAQGSLANDRRPIRVRRWAMFHILSGGLARKGVSANAISVIGMLAACAAGTMLAATSGTETADRWLFAGAAALIQFRLLCNLLDGMVAIECGKASPTGVVFNEVPDRVSDIAVLLGAGFATHSSPVLGAVAAMCAVLVTYVRVFGSSLGQPGDYRGPMAKQQRMFFLTLGCLAMALVPAMTLATMTITSDQSTRGPMWWALAIIILGCAVTALRRFGAHPRTCSRQADC